MKAALVMLACCAALVATNASAQSSCRTIADDKERLACYDKAAGAKKSAAPVEQTPNSRAAQTLANDAPDDYRAVVAAYLRKSLKDPASVRDAEISNLAIFQAANINATRPTTYYPTATVCVRLNARNSMGGYTGITTFLVTFKDKKVVDVLEGILDRAPACQGRRY